MKTRAFCHFLTRILRYDALLSAAAPILILLLRGSDFSANGAVATIALGIPSVAGTVGYAFSVLLYVRFCRNELPLYTNAGLYLFQIVSLGWGVVAAFSLAVAFGLLSAARWLSL